jgi:hypothetical protein
MPYIAISQRKAARKIPLTVGELNYAITILIQEYVARQGGVNYENVNAVQGVLRCVADEFDREIVGPYEARKRRENGDVWFIRDGQTLPRPDPL